MTTVARFSALNKRKLHISMVRLKHQFAAILTLRNASVMPPMNLWVSADAWRGEHGAKWRKIVTLGFFGNGNKRLKTVLGRPLRQSKGLFQRIPGAMGG